MSDLWMSAISEFRERVSSETYRIWIEPIVCDGLHGGRLSLRVPNQFFADWISAHYLEGLLSSIRKAAPEAGAVEVNFIVDATIPVSELPDDIEVDDRATVPGSVSAISRSLSRRAPIAARSATRRYRDDQTGELMFERAPTPSAPPPSEYALNPRYHFDNFIVGSSNQLAHAASIAASESPGKRYNPLFIYSKVGLGKTHLVNAVGHGILEQNPSARVYFLSAERFTNEFISALQHKRIDQFRARYRSECDVLVIDDIQFLAGREQTQEEFFHTFNALYHADKQIVVTSDVYPQRIAEMQERLISRFQWGLVADIQAPELDTRIAILRKKAEQERLPLTDEVALFVAQVVQSNVRELEGTLLRIAMKAELMGRPIDLPLVREMLGTPVAQNAERLMTVDDVQRVVADYFGVRVADLKSDKRHRTVSLPRMVAMYIARERLKLSYPELGDRFGGKDHTTVMSACRKINATLVTDDALRTSLEVIEKKLGF